MIILPAAGGNFIGPVKLYLTFSALYFLFAWTVLADLRGGSAERTSQNRITVNMARQRGMDPIVLTDKIYQKAERFATGLRFFGVLISGTFLAALYFRKKKYYVEHLVFSLYYYSFDFFCKSVFALVFLVTATLGFKLLSLILNFFYPIALLYLIFALRRVYQQKWAMTGLESGRTFRM